MGSVTVRHTAREMAFLTVYQLDLNENPLDFALDSVLEEAELDEESTAFCKALAQKTLEKQSEIDALIQKHMENWTLKRMPSVDRNILRLAVCEMLYLPEIPDKVAINEAIELAKTYSDEKAPRFINSVLDKILKEKQA